jgi:type IV pilus assembly protein PilB
MSISTSGVSHTITSDQQLHAYLNRISHLHPAVPDASHGEGFVTAVERPAGVDLPHQSLSLKLGVPYVHLAGLNIDPHALGMLSADIARKFTVLPVLVYENRLVMAMDDPTALEVIDILRFATGYAIEPIIANKKEISETIEKYYGMENGLDTQLFATEDDGQAAAERETGMQEAERQAMEKPIVRLVSGILIEAIRKCASDIHIRPQEHDVDLIYRIDGSLIKIRSFSKSLLPAVVSRIKIIGRMNIAERRLPQDGRSRVSDNGAVVDLRISVMPTVNGESVVIRLLNTKVGLKQVSELGFNARDGELLVDMLHKSCGMILVTGPTGSGKSTTLYAALQEVIKQNVNIITVEDPVEYHIDGIEQIHINTAQGYTFAEALRHILRHDPDVIMVGEIRDHETAKISVESALTGHLVLSTLHTNSAAGAISRLLEMEIEPYLLSSTLLGVLAQRLVKRNCTHCIDIEPVDHGIRKLLGVADNEVFYHGTGCDQCNHTGHKGRIAVYELLKVTAAIKELIDKRVDIDTIFTQSRRDGMTPLTENALQRARTREISLAEVYRVRLE